MSLEMPANNVFLSKQELDVAIAALRGTLRTIPGLSEDAIHILEGTIMELRYARRHCE